MTQLNLAVGRFTPREGGYARGAEGYELILQTALSVLVNHGYRAMTLRRIASECGIKAGNITYYFKSKDALVRALLEAIRESYKDALGAAIAEARGDPQRKLQNLIRFFLQNGAEKQAAYLFPELWSLANHDPLVKELVDDLYVRQHGLISTIVGELNPSLNDDQRSVVVSFIISSLEGVSVLAGYGKLWQGSMLPLQDMACDCLIAYVEKMKPADNIGADRVPTTASS